MTQEELAAALGFLPHEEALAAAWSTKKTRAAVAEALKKEEVSHVES